MTSLHLRSSSTRPAGPQPPDMAERVSTCSVSVSGMGASPQGLVPSGRWGCASWVVANEGVRFSPPLRTPLRQRGRGTQARPHRAGGGEGGKPCGHVIAGTQTHWLVLPASWPRGPGADGTGQVQSKPGNLEVTAVSELARGSGDSEGLWGRRGQREGALAGLAGLGSWCSGPHAP